MATYAFSDVHGHRVPLERLLERVSPADDDTLFMLGDMVDRGPDPVGVLRICHDLKNVRVIMGNHEDLMVAYFQDTDDPMVKMNWEINGSYTTLSGLEALDEQTRIELVDWVINLPFGAVTKVNDRFYIMVHAGIRPTGSLPRDQLTSQGVKDLLLSQDPEDLLWIREEFWSVPTGLVDENGVGPIVIAGHTPTAYLEGMANYLERSPQGEDGLCRQVKVGACEATGGVADRWDIDSGAAGGAGFGQVSMVRLDDGKEFYEPIAEGE